MKQRDYRFDNIKCLLILLVVFGHMIEQMPGEQPSLIYRFIYLFHMPAFIFLTGRVASFKPRRVFSMLWAYLLMDTVYIWFFNHLSPENAMEFNYVTPYWISWYMLITAMYLMVLPLMGEANLWKWGGFLTAAVVLSLIAGRDDSIGYGLCLSRFFTFLPYFLAGYFIRGLPKVSGLLDRLIRKWRILLFALTVGALYVLCRWTLFHAQVTRYVLWGPFSYETAYYGPLLKLILLFTGGGFILLLFLLTPNRKLPVISMVGRNTLSVYVLHGLIVLYLRAHPVLIYSEKKNLLLAASIAVGLTLLLSLPPVAWVTKEVFAGHMFGQAYDALKKACTYPAGKREKR